MPLPRPLLWYLLVALLGAGKTVVAAPPAGQRVPQAQRNDDALSDSVRRIERSTRGQILSAERVPYDGRNVNRIKIVDDRGRVRVYMDDPQSRPPPQPEPPTRGNDD
ncbi:MAG TPA: hypothetical protein VHF02_05790 [Luteimonas sp.]|nr:hypothetical protein [Luteimonas sp.]